MNGYLIISLVFAAILLVFWRVNVNYKVAERLIEEFKVKSAVCPFEKVVVQAIIPSSESIFMENCKVYFSEKGLLFFQGKDEIDYLIRWFYYDSSDKYFIENCQIRGKIVSIKNENGKTTYLVKQSTKILFFQLPEGKMEYVLSM